MTEEPRIYNGQRTVSNKWCWGNWTTVSHNTQKLRKWIKDFNIRPEIIRLLEENIGGKLLDVALDDDFFFKLSPKQRQEKQK